MSLGVPIQAHITGEGGAQNESLPPTSPKIATEITDVFCEVCLQLYSTHPNRRTLSSLNLLFKHQFKLYRLDYKGYLAQDIEAKVLTTKRQKVLTLASHRYLKFQADDGSI